MKRTNIEILRSDCITEDGILYEYTLFSSESARVASFKLPLYSITVKMTDNSEVTEGTVNDVFADLGKATLFYELLVKNLATPVDLTYVLEDRISI